MKRSFLATCKKQGMVRVLSALLIIVLCTPWTLTGCFPAADYYFKSTRIDDSNFPDDNFRNFLLESKYNEDGFLEARALFETSLDVSSRDIRDLKGIEHFPNLTYLDCSDNQLAALDVNKNTELERLDCSNNQLVGLDLTSNPKLQRVYCSGNRLIEVEGLSDSVNSVSGLDQSITVPVKPDGRNGYVSFGSFSSDIRLIPSADLSASYDTQTRKFTVLAPDETVSEFVVNLGKGREIAGTVTFTPDIVINAANFPDDNFRGFLLNSEYETDGRLNQKALDETSLDISGKGIHDFKGIEYFLLLKQLDCSDPGYDEWAFPLSSDWYPYGYFVRYYKRISLDVSNNVELEYINCSNNGLDELNLGDNARLTHLDCSGNNIGSLDLSNYTALEYLNCSATQISSLDLSNHTALEYLNCSVNQISSLDLSNNSELEYFNCHDNQLTSLDVSSNVKLKDLVCSGNQFTTLDVGGNTSLGRLYCSNNQLLDIRGLNATTKLNASKQKVTVSVKSNGWGGYESSGTYLFETGHTLDPILPASYDPSTQKFTIPTQLDEPLEFKTDLGQNHTLSGTITFDIS